MSKSKNSAAAVVPAAADAEPESTRVAGATAAAPTADVDLLDEEFEAAEAAAAEPLANDLEGEKSPKPPTDKEIEEGGGDSMLARYFREMATHPVMGPEEELKTAIEVENAEMLLLCAQQGANE